MGVSAQILALRTANHPPGQVIPFLDLQAGKLEGVPAVRPSEGLCPGITVVVVAPISPVLVVDGPVDLQGLARIGIFNLIFYDVCGDGHIAAVLVFHDQAGQAEAVGVSAQILALRTADHPPIQVIPFLDLQAGKLEVIPAVRPSEGLCPGITVVIVGPGCTFRIIDCPVDLQGLACVGIDHLPIQLILLQGQGPVCLLAGIADVLGLLIPAVEGIALGDRGIIEAVGLQILSVDVIRVAVVCDLVAVGVQDVVVHRVLVPDHSDNIGPAVDGDLSQALHVLAFLVLFPGAVVEPAVKQETLRKLIRFVVVVDAERGQV